MTHKKPPATVEIGGKKRGGRKGKDLCSVPECGRLACARGLCQTHHLQMLKTGEVKPIRPYRKRTAGTVSFAGFRLTPFAADRIQEYADEQGLTQGAAIAAILEDWNARGKRGAPRSKHA